ncbi:MAG: DUF2085 domain-containing protein [Anaerolineales bacterium]|nr:DUF2085 domain-containing protein [Anaerolineales bacterium]
MSTTPATRTSRRPLRVDILTLVKENLVRYWILLFIAFGLLWIGLPWMAPVLMRLGWENAANAIYTFYSFQCHQLPQRSFFLFGPQTMYSLDQLKSVGVDTSDILALRAFIGNTELGYKVAWSDRMVSAYGSIPLLALLWWPFRKRIKALPILGFFLLIIPIVLDGGSHFISDLAGTGMGFRYTNDWLATLTNNILPVTFYSGNALGSFNSWMRLITGTLFGIAVVWLAFPYVYNIGIESISLRSSSYKAVRQEVDGEKTNPGGSSG